MRDDLRAAVRSLRSSKTFTAVALIVLTLGIGASTAIFSVVDAVVLRGLPFDEHDRLVAIGERRETNSTRQEADGDPDQLLPIAPQNYIDWVARQQVFESLAAIRNTTFAIREPGVESEELRGQRVTASIFDVLRQYPRLGRAFTSDNEVEGRHLVAVLSHGLWMRRYGGDPGVIGKTIPIEGGPYEVVGVMAPEFEYPVGELQPTDVWVPYAAAANERVRLNESRPYLRAVARLRPGVSLDDARANMQEIAGALRREFPDWNRDVGAGVRPLVDHIVGARTKQWMLLLLGTVAIVLLIACANVANLLLARATVREREISVRAALGASRLRLLRQLMAESLLLSCVGTLLALLLAWWVVGVLKNAMPAGLPRVATIAVDLRVLTAAGLLSLITGCLFGIVPALQLSRPDVASALKDSIRGASAGRAKQRLRGALVVAEVALAVILLVGAALFIGSFRQLMTIDPGLDAKNVLTLQVVPRLAISTPDERPDFGPQLEEILGRIRRVPGVRYAAATSGSPFTGSMTSYALTIPGRRLEGPDRSMSTRRVTPDYHLAMGIPLVAGRYLAPSDRAGTMPVVILNATAARRFFRGVDPIGRVIGLSGTRTIVGVVGDVHQRSLEMELLPEAYTPMAQQPTIFSEVVVKTEVDPYARLSDIKGAILTTAPDALIRSVQSIEDTLSRLAAQRRLNMLLLGLFGLLGLVIAVVGIYGLMAYVVAQRTREIGVRMALGATRGSVLSMVLRNATVLIVTGLAIGATGAWFLSAAAEDFLFRIDANDPRAFAAALGTLAAAALLASLIPARRAASVDPSIALRSE